MDGTQETVLQRSPAIITTTSAVVRRHLERQERMSRLGARGNHPVGEASATYMCTAWRAFRGAFEWGSTVQKAARRCGKRCMLAEHWRRRTPSPSAFAATLNSRTCSDSTCPTETAVGYWRWAAAARDGCLGSGANSDLRSRASTIHQSDAPERMPGWPQ